MGAAQTDRTSQKLAELVPTVAARAELLVNWLRERGGPLVIIEAYRSPARQAELFADPRKVTETLRSRHQEGRAFDVAWILNGRLTWDVPQVWWDYCGRVGEAYGLRWGGRWTTLRDYGHFEL